jgi:hypothetical protein
LRRLRSSTTGIVRGDSDLVAAVDQVKARFPENEVIAYVPARTPIRGAAAELRGAADKDRTPPLDLLRHCQLPASAADGAGATIESQRTGDGRTGRTDGTRDLTMSAGDRCSFARPGRLHVRVVPAVRIEGTWTPG